MDKAWKKFERSVAQALGCERRVGLGRSVDDITFGPMHIDCKVRKRFAIWSLFRETQRKYSADGKPVVLVIKEAGRRGALVVMDFRDWLPLVTNGLLEETGAYKTPCRVEVAPPEASPKAVFGEVEDG
ncbi:MAG: hypothetical protein H5T73_11515 [Actinobacteria bacterium]|nr:hypothetical protein [Actinomycetota bacterium]